MDVTIKEALDAAAVLREGLASGEPIPAFVVDPLALAEFAVVAAAPLWLTVRYQRKEVVHHMSESSFGTLEVVGR